MNLTCESKNFLSVFGHLSGDESGQMSAEAVSDDVDVRKVLAEPVDQNVPESSAELSSELLQVRGAVRVDEPPHLDRAEVCPDDVQLLFRIEVS